MSEFIYYVQLLCSYITIPYLLCLIGITCVLIPLLLKTKLQRKGMVYLLILYTISLYSFSVFTRASFHEFLIRPIPFWSYVLAIQVHDYYLLVQNGLNILLFLPIGFLGAMNFKERDTFKYGMMYCLTIELSQFLLQKGYLDIDDIIHNGLGLLLGIYLWKWIQKLTKRNKYVITRYDFKTDQMPLRIFVMSDLHEFKVDHYLEEIKKAGPDLILLVGDVLERREGHKHQKKTEYKGNWFFYRLAWFIDDVLEFFFGEQDRKSEYSYEFLIEARKVAPIIYSRGNHERDMQESDYAFLKAHDILFLDNQDIEITVRGRKLRIGGLSTQINELWLEEFSKKSGYKILMMHHPEYYEELPVMERFDLVLSGHAHGGQIRIANQGLFSPGQGIFPKVTKGIYSNNHIVSTGCSNTSLIPRLGNPKEVILLEI